jgi:hypothetical protein
VRPSDVHTGADRALHLFVQHLFVQYSPAARIFCGQVIRRLSPDHGGLDNRQDHDLLVQCGGSAEGVLSGRHELALHSAHPLYFIHLFCSFAQSGDRHGLAKAPLCSLHCAVGS